MKLNWLIMILLLLLLLGCKQTTPSLSEAGDIEALGLARKENKPIMVNFYSERCGWCHKLDRTTYINLEVIELSKKFIPVKIDCDRNRLIPAKYRIRGLPTILFIDSKGDVVHSVVGYRKAKDFILEMKKALEKFRGL